MNVSLCDNAIDVIDIDDLFEGKYIFPLTVEEYRKHLLFNGLNTDIIDFYEDVKTYQRLYYDWKSYRKKEKTNLNDSSEMMDNGTNYGNPNGANHDHESGDDLPGAVSNNNTAIIREMSGLRASSNDDIEIYDEEKERDNKIKKSSTTNNHSTNNSNSHLSCSNPSLNPLPVSGSQDRLMRTGGSASNAPYGMDSKASKASKASNTSKKSGKKHSSKLVSSGAIKIFKKYLVTDAPIYLYMLPEKSVSPIINHYVKAMETADKTGLRFIPSPERAFSPLLKLCRNYMWDEDEYFPAFVNVSVGNTVPSSAANSFYQYRSSVTIISYVQTLLFAVLAGCVILMKIFSKANRYWLSFLCLPILLMVSTYLLATRHIGFWLWLQEKREMLILRTGNGTESADKNVEIQPINMQNTFDEEKAENVRIEVRKSEDPVLQKLQNGLVYRIFALALSTSLLITAIFVFLWPEK